MCLARLQPASRGRRGRPSPWGGRTWSQHPLHFHATVSRPRSTRVFVRMKMSVLGRALCLCSGAVSAGCQRDRHCERGTPIATADEEAPCHVVILVLLMLTHHHARALAPLPITMRCSPPSWRKTRHETSALAPDHALSCLLNEKGSRSKILVISSTLPSCVRGFASDEEATTVVR